MRKKSTKNVFILCVDHFLSSIIVVFLSHFSEKNLFSVFVVVIYDDEIRKCYLVRFVFSIFDESLS